MVLFLYTWIAIFLWAYARLFLATAEQQAHVYSLYLAILASSTSR